MSGHDRGAFSRVLSEKHTHAQCGHAEAGQVGDQGCRERIARFFDACRAKIDADGVERRFGRTEHDRCRPADLGIDPVFPHQICPDGQRRAAAERPDKYQRRDLRRDAKQAEDRRENGREQRKKAALPQHRHRRQHQHQRGGQREHQPQPVLCTGQHSAVNILLFCDPCRTRQQQKRRQQQLRQVLQHRFRPFAARIPAPTEQADASHTAGRISNACAAPSCARTAATVDGISCKDAVFITTSRHSSSDAPPPPDSACIRCAVRMPSGVAALPNPSRFALRLPHRFQKPSESFAHTGNSRRSTGRSAVHSPSVSPARSIACDSPDQRQTGPASVSASSSPARAPLSPSMPDENGIPVSRSDTNASKISPNQRKFNNIFRSPTRKRFFVQNLYIIGW